ncbi:hypothetical protein RISK_002288 [Rhodopirellula islandica]|uniref:Uncharacterized protein n=1 Tax=Rhodopirellula islandica TaxID=595434 RepID=A0A0J1BGK5_RHOIS|nr:hypothetical protein RISK_002288 [Rhodopirellula islandica]
MKSKSCSKEPLHLVFCLLPVRQRMDELGDSVMDVFCFDDRTAFQSQTCRTTSQEFSGAWM